GGAGGGGGGGGGAGGAGDGGGAGAGGGGRRGGGGGGAGAACGPPPARPADLPAADAVLRLRGAAPRPLDLAVADRARPDHRRGNRRLVPLHEDPGAARQQPARRRPGRDTAPAGPRPPPDPASGPEPRRR